MGDEVNFFNAAGDQGACFAHDGFLGAAAVLTADFRNDAERARVIAAFGYFDIGEVFGGQAEARGVIIRDPPWFVGDEVAIGEFFRGEEAIDDIWHFGELVQSDEGVDLRHEGR